MSKTKLRKEYEARFGDVEGVLRLYNAKGNMIYREYSDGYWSRWDHDAEGNEIYCEHSNGYWVKMAYDAKDNKIYCENSVDGVTLDNRSCDSKVFIDEQTGKKFKMTEVK